MKKFIEWAKRLLALIVAVAIIFSTTDKVNAAQETIELGDAPYVNERYIANVGFYHKQTTDGKELYCLNINKSTAKNTTATLVKDSKYIDGGIVYILKNGYPNKSITGNDDKDYYITQTAVWWYLDEVHGSTNLGDQFKENGTVTANGTGMREIIKNLVTEAKKHTNDSTSSTTEFVLSTNATMSLSGSYYVSNDIKASKATNITSYTVKLTNAPSGTKIINNGTESDYTGEFTVNATDSFKIKVPVEALSSTNTEITVDASATGTESYAAYEYQPTDSKMQNVALLEKTTKTIASGFKLTISSSKVTVVKIDSNTKKAISGAKLVLKDSSGKIITSWTSTTNAHVIRNLSNGTYTIEETEAPTGYTLNTNITTFTIDANNKDIKINIENAPNSVDVPDTASTSSIIITILGITILGSGIFYVYKKKKLS